MINFSITHVQNYLFKEQDDDNEEKEKEDDARLSSRNKIQKTAQIILVIFTIIMYGVYLVY